MVSGTTAGGVLIRCGKSPALCPLQRLRTPGGSLRAMTLINFDTLMRLNPLESLVHAFRVFLLPVGDLDAGRLANHAGRIFLCAGFIKWIQVSFVHA